MANEFLESEVRELAQAVSHVYDTRANPYDCSTCASVRWQSLDLIGETSSSEPLRTGAMIAQLAYGLIYTAACNNGFRRLSRTSRHARISGRSPIRLFQIQ
jgi:hypothetical protein